VSVEFAGAQAVVDASKCALDREYSKREHEECKWCSYDIGNLLKAVATWMGDAKNSAEIAQFERSGEALW
jgi:hypothetical protein